MDRSASVSTKNGPAVDSADQLPALSTAHTWAYHVPAASEALVVESVVSSTVLVEAQAEAAAASNRTLYPSIPEATPPERGSSDAVHEMSMVLSLEGRPTVWLLLVRAVGAAGLVWSIQ